MKRISQCLHCLRTAPIEGRGLCCRCWHDEVIRYQYPTFRDFYGNTALDAAPCPPTATEAKPGTCEKVKVMADRVSSGFQPHHPDDAKTPISVRIVTIMEVSSCL